MGILKTNSARGAFKGVSEWLSKHTHIKLNETYPESDVVLVDDGYDLASRHLGEYCYDSKRLYFEPECTICLEAENCLEAEEDIIGYQPIKMPGGKVSVSMPKCFSQSFLDRQESLYIGSPSTNYSFYIGAAAFDPADLMSLPSMPNLTSIICWAPPMEDLTEFVKQMCDGAKHISSKARVEVNIGKRDKLVISEYNPTIHQHLKKIDIGQIKQVIIHRNYFEYRQVEHFINSGILQDIDVIGEPLITASDTSEDRRVVLEICHSDMDRVNVPDSMKLKLTNCHVGNIDDILKRDPLITNVDSRTLIKSNKGVDPTTSTAIDMFGNCIYVGDTIAFCGRDRGIKFAQVIKIEGEEVMLNNRIDLDDNISWNSYTSSYDLSTNMYKISSTNMYKIRDCMCWKIQRSFFDQSNRNGFVSIE